jgi:hypothetical protein
MSGNKTAPLFCVFLEVNSSGLILLEELILLGIRQELQSFIKAIKRKEKLCPMN